VSEVGTDFTAGDLGGAGVVRAVGEIGQAFGGGVGEAISD